MKTLCSNFHGSKGACNSAGTGLTLTWPGLGGGSKRWHGPPKKTRSGATWLGFRSGTETIFTSPVTFSAQSVVEEVERLL